MKITKIFNLSLSLVSSMLLAGCSNMNSQFDCNVGSGGKCAPMHQINRLADTGGFHESAPVNKIAAPGSGFGYPINTFAGAPIRNKEQVQQIWLGPYEDVNGNYHEPAYIYVVSKKGSWIGEPAQVIQD